MRLRTANKRRNRNIWKKRGHVHISFNPGHYTWFDLIHEGHNEGPMHIPFDRSQPRAYTNYPHA